MYKLKNVLVMFLIIILIFVVFILNAQEKDNGIIKEPKKGEGIDKGMVVAFGKKIHKPYFVTQDDGKILINDIVFIPREKDPSKEQKEVVVTEMDVKKHELIKSCENNYVKYYNSEGKQKAKEKILKEYGNNSIVSKLKFEDDILIIEFNDGRHINIMLNSFIMESKRKYPTEEEIISQRKEEIEGIKSFLQQKWMIAFGYEYTMYIPTKKAQEINSIVINIKDGRIPKANGRENIVNITSTQKFAEDILFNIDSWRIK